MTLNVSEGSDTFVEVFPIIEPGYLTVYDWEVVELTKLRRWVGQNWKVSIYASVIYVILIYLGQSWMKNRPAYNLRNYLLTWNVILALFSFIGFARTAPELWHVINEPYGFYISVCTRHWVIDYLGFLIFEKLYFILLFNFFHVPNRREHNAATACWGFLMTMSKLIELGDTAFIVLRKQPLRFLHWYHHVTVMCYTFATYEDYEPSLRWFMTMNMAVHALMYTYYALRAMRVKVPRQWAMVVTCLQISQMIFGVFINLYTVWVKRSGIECVRSNEVIQLALLMYASYLVLFANFFYQSYVKSSPKSLKVKQK